MEYKTDKDWVTIKCGDPMTYPEPEQTIIYTLSVRVTSGWGKRRRQQYENFPCIGRVVKEKGTYEFARVGGNAFKNGYVVPHDIAQWMPAPVVLRDLNVTPPMSPGIRFILCLLMALAILMPAILMYQSVRPDPYLSRLRTQYGYDLFSEEEMAKLPREDREQIETERKIVGLLKEGKNEEAAKIFQDAVDKGLLARGNEDRIAKKAKMTRLEYNVSNMPFEEALDVFLDSDATKEEREALAPILAEKYEGYTKRRAEEAETGKETVLKYVLNRLMQKLEQAKKLGIVEMAQRKAQAADAK